MINTYTNDWTPEAKIAEELRLIRCILERQLSFNFPKAFVDYQMEKFGSNYQTEPEPTDGGKCGE